MELTYKNTRLESVMIGLNILAAVAASAAIVSLYGFHIPLAKPELLVWAMAAAIVLFLIEKAVRFFNCAPGVEFINANWFEIPILIVFGIIFYGIGRWFESADPKAARTLALAVYLIIQILVKSCRSAVSLAASGRNPAKALIGSFIVLIMIGAGILMLPKSYKCGNVSFIDALFTATSATCVTGLVVKDTGADFSLAGQIVILTLIQLGGLGIVMFGAVFALLVGQALSRRESVAMQDLLSTQTLGRISRIIGFIFVGTILFEAVGAVALYPMWYNLPEVSNPAAAVNQRWFYSIFHSISAFCNAGFGLFSNSLVDYSKSMGVHLVIAPLIILGGLGFGVLYNISEVAADRLRGFIPFRKSKKDVFRPQTPQRLRLQAKIVLLTSLILIITGMVALLILENNTAPGGGGNVRYTSAEKIGNALFQSVTARTAGFNTIDIASMAASSRFVLMILMFIGGSPVSTAGGIKTVTFAVMVMVVFATLRKRPHVELFRRTVPLVVVGRAVTITLLFAAVLVCAIFALSITERQNPFGLDRIAFEAVSALGTVGLSTGITPALTTGGKLIIIIVMLIGRLGPMTLLASITFNMIPARYEYPFEPLVVG